MRDSQSPLCKRVTGVLQWNEVKVNGEKFSMRQTATWDGITRSDSLFEEHARRRKELFESAKSHRWTELLTSLSEQPKLVNVACPDDTSLYTLLHWAANEGAPVEIVQRMLELGAWRTLRNKDGERPIDIASRVKHEYLYPILEPVFRQQIPPSIRQHIQRHFHEVIRGSRAKRYVEKHSLRLPELEPLLEMDTIDVWFTVPGMYGGFNYWLERDGEEAKLVAQHWSRVVGMSGQRHEITSEGSTLVASGFG